MNKVTADELNRCLPQTQCGECGYPGCRPYAEAIVHGKATIDACPPGGVETLHALADIMQLDPKPYEAEVKANTRPPQQAIIREAECIGCTKCLPACPVDAIIGASKQLHQVIAHECTGCGLCVEPCPVDCIDMVELPAPVYDKDVAEKRFEAKNIRALKEAQAKERSYQAKRHLKQNDEDKQAKKAYILEALKRAGGK